MSRGALDNKFVYFFVVIALIALSLAGIFIVQKFMALATYIPAEAGYITEVEIRMRYDAHLWAGGWGFVVWVPGYSGADPSQTFQANEIKQINNMFFNCIDGNGGEIFASTASSIDFDSVRAGNTSVLDSYLNVTASYPMSGTSTLTQNISFFLGNTNISGVPAMYTFQADNPNSQRFDVGLLTDDSGNLIFVTTSIFPSRPDDLYSNESPVFGNYQAILPIPENTSQTYNFFRDPYETCPSGTEQLSNGTISGVVRDNRTNLTVANATVVVGAATTLSNASGQYWMNTVEGRYQLVGIKTGYEIYMGTVDIYAGFNISYNFSMEPMLARTEYNGSIIGFVIDNATGDFLTNVTVSIGIETTLTNTSGLYNLTAPAGEYLLAGVKDGYYPHTHVLNITAHNITFYNFSLGVIPPPGLGPGAGAGAGAGQGAGAGAGAGEGAGRQEIVIERPGQLNYYIGIQSLKKKVRIGQFIEDTIKVYNFKNVPLYLTLSLSGDVLPYVLLDKEELVVPPDSTNIFTVTMFGFNETGVFTGNLHISGDLNDTIPIELTVRSRELLPIQALVMRLDTFKDKVNPGSNLDYKLDLRNLLTDVSYGVHIKYNITNQNKSVNLLINEEDVDIQTFVSLIDKYEIPKEFEEGNYVLTATAHYLNLTSSTSTLFRVAKPFYMYAIFGVLPLWLLALILLAMLLMAYFIYRYRKEQLAKKRYVMKVEFKLLPKAGPRSAYVGKIAETERKAYIDLDKLTTHTIVAGSTGGGKTVAAQDIIEEALLKGIAVIVFDPTAQWSGMLRKCENKKMLELYSKFGMKPSDATSFNGNVRAITDSREIIDIKKYLKPGEIQIFTINKLDPKDIDIFVANTVREIFHANFPEEQDLKYMIVYDEVHRLLPKFGGSGEGFIQIERACREFRKWGIGMLLISQVLADFVGQIKANINTEIQMRTRDEGDLKRIAIKYGRDQLRSLVKASVGSGMVQNAAYNRGLPYFISFRPMMHSIRRLSDEELEQYNQYNNIIDEYEYQLEQLEEEGVDVFDMKLELKLALDKVKSGSFNMVEIYLEGLTSRLNGEWKKIGKTPKKKKIELVKEAALKQELEKAKKAREQYLKEEEKQVKKEVKKEKIVLFEKIFPSMTFDNGAIISTLHELLDALKGMDDEIFAGHVNNERNDIYEWIKTAVKDADVMSKIRDVTGKNELTNILETERKKKRVVEEVEELFQETTKMEGIGDLIKQIELLIQKGDLAKAKLLYQELQTLYALLPTNEKSKYYDEIKKVIKSFNKPAQVL